jgi:predicted HD superfamily hydrolase involved in NAD metabolism
LIDSGTQFVAAARRVREHISQQHRYIHILRVARTAEALARTHHVDPQRARIAGLLHDLARLYPGERLLRECEERGMPIGDFERANPIVLHAPLGA